ncbi:MAG: hypothetical protein JSS83_07555 [Cyanobacteria bacterium SZAS LIN-3]|nr:hypothetical protein [Cyanobacteria bacterium SZAS LIN-3]MBS2007259.1 hypothetical protein [Cyanobacteria bacterium SZAS TMP-1]
MKVRSARKHLSSTVLCLSLMVLSGLPALAQGSNQTGFAPPTGQPFINPLYQQGAPDPPPIGSGNVPPQVNPGDTGAVPAVPSGQADQSNGSDFQVTPGQDRVVAHLYMQDQANGRGTRYVQTIRGDQLSDEALGQIQGILGVNLIGGNQAAIDVAVTTAQLEQIQEVLAPYPQTSMVNGRKKIMGDNPAAGYPKPGRDSLYAFDGILPTVQTFSRYLVILGVVAATIFMSLAAWAMVQGNPYGGARVMGSAAGLLMLLAAYTIWKIVQMNTFGANSNNPAISQNRTNTAQIPSAFAPRPNVPVTPNQAQVGGAPREGVPVQPLGNAGQ